MILSFAISIWDAGAWFHRGGIDERCVDQWCADERHSISGWRCTQQDIFGVRKQTGKLPAIGVRSDDPGAGRHAPGAGKIARRTIGFGWRRVWGAVGDPDVHLGNGRAGDDALWGLSA